MYNEKNPYGAFMWACRKFGDLPAKIDNEEYQYSFHEKILGGQKFREPAATIARKYKESHTMEDLAEEAAHIAKLICVFNTKAAKDWDIAEGFLDRKYNVKLAADKSNAAEVLAEFDEMIDLYKFYRKRQIPQQKFQDEFFAVFGIAL